MFDNETRCYNNVDANRTVTDTIELWFHPQWKKGWLRPQFLRHNKSYAGTPCLVSIFIANITLALEENPKRTSSISHHTICARSLPWVNAALRMRQTEVAKSVFAVVLKTDRTTCPQMFTASVRQIFEYFTKLPLINCPQIPYFWKSVCFKAKFKLWKCEAGSYSCISSPLIDSTLNYCPQPWGYYY